MLDESDEEGMADLLEAATTPLFSTAEQSAVVEETRVEPFDRVDGARRALLVNEASTETVDAPLGGVNRKLEMPAEPLTTELLSKEGIEASMPPHSR